ncbi:MAG: EamA family transporter [Acidobacteriota bacterium]|nr:EamA family transporter [Acidobacteriota bacterium]MDH3786316.1 EamA family transporter [Acidobacteriota bacterium]
MSSARALRLAVFAALCLIWGTTWSVIRVGLEGIPPFAGVAIRFFIAGVLLAFLARLLGVRMGRLPNERTLWIVNGVLSFCVSYGVVYWGEQWVPSGLAAVLFATYPLFVSILGHFLLPDERLGWADGVGALVGFTGVAVLYSADFDQLGGTRVREASFVMLLAPLASAIASVAIKRWGKGIHALSLTAPPMILAGVIMGVVSASSEDLALIRLDRTSVLALLYLTIAGSAVTFTLYYWLLSRMQARRVALVAFIVPVIAVLIGTLLGEPFTIEVVVGSLLVVSGVAVAGFRSALTPKVPRPPQRSSGSTPGSRS